MCSDVLIILTGAKLISGTRCFVHLLEEAEFPELPLCDGGFINRHVHSAE